MFKTVAYSLSTPADSNLFLSPLCRLIQFPPPPLKGGITVTMEDLQCLDSGQFLNDVIIDFYLKCVTTFQTKGLKFRVLVSNVIVLMYRFEPDTSSIKLLLP